MARVDPGELKWTITIEIPARTTDSNGHYIQGTPQQISCRAAVRAAKSQDVIDAGAARMEETIQFIVRWRAGITTDCTVIFNGIRYDLDFVDPVPWAGGYMRLKGCSYDAGEGS